MAINVRGRQAYDATGAEIGWNEHHQKLGAWNQIFIPLHAAFPSHLYHTGETFESIHQDEKGVTVVTLRASVFVPIS